MRAMPIVLVTMFAACSKDKPADYPANTTTSLESAPPSPTAAPEMPAPSNREVVPPASAQVPSSPSAIQDSTPNLPNSPGATAPGSPSAMGSTSPSTGGGPRQPDNTAVNDRDRNGATLTPMNQGNSDSDRKTTQQIRKAVVADKSLSFTAKNVKIITKDGMVTLRGPVKNDAEKASIDAIARQIAGDHVDDQLEIKK